MKQLFFTMLAIAVSFASFATVGPITPSSGGMCVGSGLYVTDSSSSGGVWSSSNTAVATVSSAGYISGVGAGIVTISYTVSGISATGTYTVGVSPASITGGPTSFCSGTTATFADATPGGAWSSGSTYIATVGSTGVVTGVSSGVVFISYTVSGCSTFVVDTVTSSTVAYIDSAVTTVCAGSSITLEDATAGGTWSSGTPAVGTVNATSGVFEGISAGFTIVTYTVPGTCGPASATIAITVSSSTSAGTISGPAVVYVGGASITLNDAGASGSGTWSSSNTSIASVGAGTGVVTGVSAGTAILSYAVSGCGGTVYATQVDTVKNFNGISGYVIFDSGAYYGNVKVWLITFSSGTTLAAVDSETVSCSGDSVYYQFPGLASDSFRVKAAVTTDSAGTTGPIPTYHDTSFYWYYANVIPFVSGTTDMNEDIHMLYGTTTTGPGFIGGNVFTGANRGTSAINVVGLHMIALNTTTGTIAGMTVTDGSGNYSFSALPYGTYTIFPDSLNYTTEPYYGITLSASNPTVSGAGFEQHTLSRTITPITEAVHNVTPSVSTVSAFPNPTSGKLNIQWTEKAAEKGTISISDISGREVYHATINMTQGQGITAVDLSNLLNGVYMVNITSASLNYNDKIEVVH